MRIHTLDTGFFKLDGGAMFGVVPRSMWQKLNPPDEANLCTWAMRCLLLEHPDGRLILVDTGLGDKQDAKFMSHFQPHGEASLVGSLGRLGVGPEQITDVLLTHLHFDHVGGAARREGERIVPTFPRARYWTNRRHWDWAVRPNARERNSFLPDNILPLQEAGQLHFVEEGAAGGLVSPFGPEVELLAVDGHTEQMMLPLITTAQGRYLYPADLVPSAWHIPLPYIMAYDMRPLQTLDEKERLLTRCAAEGIALILEHDPVTPACTLAFSDRGVRMGEAFKLGITN